MISEDEKRDRQIVDQFKWYAKIMIRWGTFYTVGKCKCCGGWFGYNLHFRWGFPLIDPCCKSVISKCTLPVSHCTISPESRCPITVDEHRFAQTAFLHQIEYIMMHHHWVCVLFTEHNQMVEAIFNHEFASRFTFYCFSRKINHGSNQIHLFLLVDRHYTPMLIKKRWLYRFSVEADAQKG